jgi:adenine phosphoribosyltransferase
MVMKQLDIKQYIRSVPDFPKKGIIFKDITTLTKNPTAFKATIDQFYKQFKDKEIDAVVAIEARGFIFGAALAYKLRCGFVPVRKPHKLPAKTIRQEYQLEYGTDSLEIHTDAIIPGARVLIVDDLLATGGTVLATCELIKKLDGIIVGLAFIIELTFLKGREKLAEYEVYSITSYDSE